MYNYKGLDKMLCRAWDIIALINPLSAHLNNLNFHPLGVVSRYRDPQLQEGENYSYNVFNLTANICKS